MRTLTFAYVFVTALICFGVYRVAEDARVAHAELVVTERQIAREHQTLIVLGAEWAAVARPQRIHALAERHLDLTDMPAVELASVTLLPHRGEAPFVEGPLRDARAVVPEAEEPEAPLSAPAIRHVALRTGA